jgi:hypothetical protein
MKGKSTTVIIIVALVLVIGIAATVIVSRSKPAEQEIVSILPTDTQIIDTGTEVTMPDEQKATETASGSTVEVGETESFSPPVKTGLESTNPEVVNLASGEIQLVEFFAFW